MRDAYELWDETKQNLVPNINQFSKICRGCLATERRMIKASSYEDMFKDLTGIIISPTDGLPQWLCYECSAMLHKFVKFRKKVIKSHYRLCQYVQESVPFARNEDATPHLIRTSVLHCHISGTQTDKFAEQVYTVKPDINLIYVTETTVEVKHERTSDYEDNTAAQEYRIVTSEAQYADTLSVIDPLDLKIDAVNEKKEQRADHGEASSQEPHGTESAQQHLHKHVGDCSSKTSGYMTERKSPADTTSTRHSDDAQVVIHNKYRDDSVKSSSCCNVQSYVCDTCNKCFSDKNLLIRHIREHSAEKLFQCNVCSKCFPDKSSFTKHSRVHTAKKLYQCVICKKCYRHKRDIIQRLHKHSNEKLYGGDVSDIKLKLETSLTAEHAGDKLYKCDECMKCFDQKGNLKIHKSIHTGEKPYKCHICMKSFRKKEFLKNHVRIHTGFKPYLCDVCMKQFSQRGHLDYHMRIHTGEKAFKCDICTKRFSQKGNLKRHMRVHTKCDVSYKTDKPYKCEVSDEADKCNVSDKSDKPYRGDVSDKTDKAYKCKVRKKRLAS